MKVSVQVSNLLNQLDDDNTEFTRVSLSKNARKRQQKAKTLTRRQQRNLKKKLQFIAFEE